MPGVDPGDGYTHVNPYGSGNFVGVCDPGHPKHQPDFTCNDKLVGGAGGVILRGGGGDEDEQDESVDRDRERDDSPGTSPRRRRSHRAACHACHRRAGRRGRARPSRG